VDDLRLALLDFCAQDEIEEIVAALPGRLSHLYSHPADQ